MRAKAKTLEMQLLGWSRSNNGGSKVTFQIHDEDLEWFESMTTRKGKIAGQIIMGALVEVDAEGQPVHPKDQEKPVMQQVAEKIAESIGESKIAVEAKVVETQRAMDKPKHKGGFTDAVGPLARLAVLWCGDAKFQNWLADNQPEEWAMNMVQGHMDKTAKAVICSICMVESRKQLDEDESAAAEFHKHIRLPYQQWLEKHNEGVADVNF